MQSHQNRCENAAISLRNLRAIAVKELGDHCGIIAAKSLRDRCKIAAKLMRDRCEIAARLLQNRRANNTKSL
jgi:hypothetical protein